MRQGIVFFFAVLCTIKMDGSGQQRYLTWRLRIGDFRWLRDAHKARLADWEGLRRIGGVKRMIGSQYMVVAVKAVFWWNKIVHVSCIFKSIAIAASEKGGGAKGG